MSDQTKTKTKIEVSKEDTATLARALFKARSPKGEDKSAGDKASFKEAKGELMPLARRTLRALHKQGYGLSKS
ncbi:MAG TPA: hypothetical protein ENK28_00290 [Aliiroseovarius sp.]|nr:hypothetical protein [Aliiroseovarius sp.]